MHTLLKRQKWAADRGHHYHWIARLRISQGSTVAAAFYQGQSAHWYARAREYREQIERERKFPMQGNGIGVVGEKPTHRTVTDPRSGMVFNIANYRPTVPPVRIEIIAGSKPRLPPGVAERLIAAILEK